MRKLLLIAGVAALTLPGLALAQDDNMGPDAGMAPNDANAPYASDYGADVAYTGAPDDIMAREAWLDHRISRNENAGTITGDAAFRDRALLSSVRRRQDILRADHDGLTEDDRADLSAQLDGVNARLNDQLGEGH